MVVVKVELLVVDTQLLHGGNQLKVPRLERISELNKFIVKRRK
jgi:hypothetical protein